MQEIRFHGFEAALDFLQIAITRIDRLRIHLRGRHGGLQHVAAIQQGDLSQLRLVNLAADLLPLQRQGDEATELVALDPVLELAQPSGRIGARGLTDKGVALGDQHLEPLELVGPACPLAVLDALIAPTNGPAWMIDHVNGDSYGIGSSSLAAISGYPNITVPAGFVATTPAKL